MLARVHNKLGTAGLIVAIVALVAALAGAAFAAGGLTKKQEKQVIKIAKKYAGKNGKDGAPGPTGPAGPQGPKGDTGAKGDKGDKGDTGATGQAGMCSDEEPKCVLASGGMLTGIWSAVESENSRSSLTDISFPVRVSPAPVALYPKEIAGSTVGVKLENGTTNLYPHPLVGGLPELPALEQLYKEACPGSFATPEAASEVLCIYPGSHEGGQFKSPVDLATQDEAAHEFGIIIPFEYFSTGEPSRLRGSWAVGG